MSWLFDAKLMLRFPRLLLGLLVALAPGLAVAHNVPYSFLDLRIGTDGLSGTVLVQAADLATAIGTPSPDRLIEAAYVQSHLPEIHDALAKRLHVSADDRPLTPFWQGAFEIAKFEKTVKLHFTSAWSWTPEKLGVAGPLFPENKLHRTFVSVYEGAQMKRQDVLVEGHTQIEHKIGTGQAASKVMGTFIGQGIYHIFIGPDHILFIIGLMLMGGGLWQLLKIVTAFTVAHSITLALATLHILNPPSRLIEPIIALSIVVVGLFNLIGSKEKHDLRVVFAFVFGLVHGFGFASVLSEFGLPRASLGIALFSFNAGVEIGQMCIVLATVPLLSLLRNRSPRAGGVVTIACSWVVVAAGSFWFVQRAFLER